MVNKMNNILNDLYNKYSDIKYGWYDKDNILHDKLYEGFLANFRFQTLDHIKKSKTAICWEMVELYRDELEKMNIPSKTYFFCLKETGYHCHSIIVTKDDNYYYHLEGTLKNNQGIHKHKSLEDIFKYIIDRYDIVVNDPNIQINKDNIEIYEYSKPKEGISCTEYFFHCFGGKKIKK